MSYKPWNFWSDFVTLSIVVPTYQSNTTGQMLTIIAHLLKLRLPGNARSGEPFRCGWRNLSVIPSFIITGTTGSVSSPFLPIMLMYHTCHFLSLHCTSGYHPFEQSHTLKVSNSVCSGQFCRPYRLLFCIAIRYARLATIIDILVILKPCNALTFVAQKPDNRYTKLLQPATNHGHINKGATKAKIYTT
jgi:hypothetical protein